MTGYTLTSTSIIAGLLALGTLLALARTVFRLRTDYAPRVAAAIGWLVVLAALHIAAATTLWYTLLPPSTRISAETLQVLTGGARAFADAARPSRVVALPEASRPEEAEVVADLATALRRYPDTRRIRVTGAGLTARDRDAARSVVVEFEPAPLPAGLVELHAPTHSAKGAAWTVRGRVEGMPGASVQLIDPAGTVAASAKLDEAGRFALLANPHAIGRAEYALRILHGGIRGLAPDVAVPVVVTRGDRLTVLLLAGAPGPELKYLRRWAVDAGLDVRTRIALGAASQLATPETEHRRGRFADLDLVVLDDRAWRALGAEGDRELRAAAVAGTGVLLRITGAIGPSDRGKLAAWGFEPGELRSVASHGSEPPSGAHPGGALTLRTPSPPIALRDAQLLRDPRDGSTLGLYRIVGRGRLGLWWASDSYRLVLRGESAAHGGLWGGAFTQLARPRSRSLVPRLGNALVRVHERQFICDIGDGSLVRAPDGRQFALLRSAAATADGKSGSNARRGSTAPVGGCAAYWPRVPGWHEVRTGDVVWPFHVRPRGDAPGLFAYADQEATLRLAALRAPVVESAGTTRGQQRWPWFLAWIAATTLLWWLERSSIPVGRR